MDQKQPDWAKIREKPFAAARPPEWPENVSALNWNGMSLLGVDRKSGELYWDGTRIVTEKRWGTTERRLAIAGLVIAAVGVAATLVQAYAAVAALL